MDWEEFLGCNFSVVTNQFYDHMQINLQRVGSPNLLRAVIVCDPVGSPQLLFSIAHIAEIFGTTSGQF